MSPTSSPVFLRNRVAGDLRQGARQYQEDNFLVIDLREHGPADDDAVLLLLSDGMGGHAGGAVASEIAVNKFADAFLGAPVEASVRKKLKTALETITQAIGDRAAAEPELKGMGCTLIAVVVQDDKLKWLSVGDSPFWLLRNGALHRMNDDHSMKPVLDALVAKGELTHEEALKDGRRNSLRSAVDGSTPRLVDINDEGYRLQPGDTVILASDGLETLKESEIASLLTGAKEQNIQDRLKLLLDGVMARKQPYQDNTTAILLDANLSDRGLDETHDVTRVNPEYVVKQGVRTAPPKLDPPTEPVEPASVTSANNSGLTRLVIAACGVILAALFIMWILKDDPKPEASVDGTVVETEQVFDDDSEGDTVMEDGPASEETAGGTQAEESETYQPDHTDGPIESDINKDDTLIEPENQERVD